LFICLCNCILVMDRDLIMGECTSWRFHYEVYECYFASKSVYHQLQREQRMNSVLFLPKWEVLWQHSDVFMPISKHSGPLWTRNSPWA
jgi:hypothetical protein